MTKVRRKKSRIIRHATHDDCRECMKKVFDEQPIVKEIGSIADFKESTLHLYHTKHSLHYLLQMTILSEKEIVRIFNESGNKEVTDDRRVFRGYRADSKDGNQHEGGYGNKTVLAVVMKEKLRIMKEEPHSLCHISEVMDWIFSNERNNKSD